MPFRESEGAMQWPGHNLVFSQLGLCMGLLDKCLSFSQSVTIASRISAGAPECVEEVLQPWSLKISVPCLVLEWVILQLEPNEEGKSVSEDSLHGAFVSLWYASGSNDVPDNVL